MTVCVCSLDKRLSSALEIEELVYCACPVQFLLCVIGPYICLRITKTVIKLFFLWCWTLVNIWFGWFMFLMFSQSGLTSLHLAAQEDKVGVGEILVKNGANLDQQTKVRRALLYPKTRLFTFFNTFHWLWRYDLYCSWDTHLLLSRVTMEMLRWLIFYWRAGQVSMLKQRYFLIYSCFILIWRQFCHSYYIIISKIYMKYTKDCNVGILWNIIFAFLSEWLYASTPGCTTRQHTLN